ncbi:transmembrane protein, putative (macronuclear) [Tetrahymena thermophila SB210]|uniref:Transmembrane protein, putative n=1 Tax=Tetrahymena thermophila (strain SB210) TaxID=312017 RepID=I7LWQ2_TETTS|nr:transmembrane protein, putative [Tetrahymena thermophila SB210]EAS02638.2 transmembrane protein, putative [Tetrahymena thermophila SB210]|eukprot:XP_001022883.2 transmembrane protein, putative [Tetrahymena thermophila SB210]
MSPSNYIKYLLSLLLAIIVSVKSQSVPCYSQVLSGNFYGENQKDAWKDLDLSTDIQFKKMSSLSISFWMNIASSFQIQFSVKLSQQSYQLLSINPTTSQTNPQLLIDSSSFLQTPLKYTKAQNLWMYVFITLDVSNTIPQVPQVNLFIADSVDTSDAVHFMPIQQSQLQNLPINNFQYETFLITSGTDIQYTGTIYLHRYYGIQNITSDYQNILKMMMRDNTILISNYLFNQDLLVQYLDDNNDYYQNNIDISKQNQNSVPILFYKSLSFSAQNYITLNGFRLTQVQREFTISFSIQTVITDINPQPYTIMSFQDEKGFIIFQIILNRLNDYQEQIIFNFQYQNQNLNNTLQKCNVQRITQWNYFVITGYTYARFQSNYQPKNYYFDIYLNYQYCETVVYKNPQTFLSSDQFFIVFGNQNSQYTNYFMLKSLKVYYGAFSAYNSTCNQNCVVQQSKELTNAEKQQWNNQNPTNTLPISEQVSQQALSWLNGQTLSQYQTQSCLKCDDQRYQNGEYCLSGASQCPDGIDSSANQCLPAVLCSDPLHDSSDCIKNCIPGYQIDNTAKCSIQCGYSCAQCSGINSAQCLSSNKTNLDQACPSTRTFNSLTQQCDCKQYFYDDGISYQCIKATTVTPTSTIAKVYYVFDISYQDQQLVTIASINTKPIYQYQLSDVSLKYDQNVSNTITADVDYGIQLFQLQQFQIINLNNAQAQNMRFWLYPQSNLGRYVKLVSYTDSSNNPIIMIILNQINNFEYSLTICLSQKCQTLSPLQSKIRANMWNQIAISIANWTPSNNSIFQITIFINSFSKNFYFETYPTSIQVLQVQFGDYNNKFSPPQTQFFAVRYISFFDQPFYLNNSNNCLVTSGGNLCIVCQKGFYAKSNLSFNCIKDTPLTGQFVYDSIQMIHSCGVNQNICTNECQALPSKCINCTQGRDPKNNCNCPDGQYSDPMFKCQPCNPKCATCDNTNKCLTCKNNRINPPLCTCPSQFLEPIPSDTTSIQKGLCVPCSKSCASCDSSSCVCPDQTKTFRIQKSKYSCDCMDGYYDDTNSNAPCKKCFPNCATCMGGLENQCSSCKFDNSQVKLVKPIAGGIGFCQCQDSGQYLDYNGFCKNYTSVQFSLISDAYYFRPKIKIELTDGQQLENALTSQWITLLDIKIITNDNSLHNRRNLQTSSSQIGENNLNLTMSNDSTQPNVGYINIDVQQSCFSKLIRIVVNKNTAIRTINGVPLNPSFQNQVFEFNIQPFIMKFGSDDLNYFQYQQQILNSLQSNSFFSFIRYISIPLLFMNCLQPISTLLLINTVIPLKAHLLISQFASFVFPYTPVWINYNFNNMKSNQYKSPSYNIYGSEVSVSDQQAFYPYQQMGISANFLVNITETLVLLAINGIVIGIMKYLDDSNYKLFQGKNFYHYPISFFYNLLEVRLIYILLSVFLQFTNMQFSNGLNGVSAIFSCIFFLAMMFFYYKTYQILNSESEKGFQYKRLFHLVEYLDFKQHSIRLNYKLLHFIKKFLYMLVVVVMYNSPKIGIIFLIIISILGLFLDILTRPFSFNCINYFKIFSSIAWLVLLSALLYSFTQYQNMLNNNYIIESSTLNNYLKSGEAIFILVWLYFGFHCIIYILKLSDNINRVYKYFKDKNDDIQVLIVNKDEDNTYRLQNIFQNSQQDDSEVIGNVKAIVALQPKQIQVKDFVINPKFNQKRRKSSNQFL